jgi:transcriptional regulator with XRE-family HTH domain
MAAGMDFGRRLKALRKEKSLQQRELAILFNLSPSAIGGYERGLREPELQQLSSFAEFFDVSLDYLLGRTEERRTADKFAFTQEYEYFDFMHSHTITMNGQILSEDDKRRLCDMAVGFFWMHLQERH